MSKEKLPFKIIHATLKSFEARTNIPSPLQTHSFTAINPRPNPKLH